MTEFTTDLSLVEREGKKEPLFMDDMPRGHKIFDGFSGDDIIQCSSASGWKNSLVFWIMALGSTAKKFFFSYSIFLFSNQTLKTLRSDFLLGLVITSLEHGSSRAGVHQAEILDLREGASSCCLLLSSSTDHAELTVYPDHDYSSVLPLRNLHII